VLNGALYLIAVETLKETRSFCPQGTLPLVMPTERSIDIDGMDEWVLAERLLKSAHGN